MSSILFTSINIIITIVGLIFIYHKREGEEVNLGWKVFGYSFLGAFTFRLNNFPLPLGFIIYLLFFHPKINPLTKRKAAYLGLLIFILGAVYPPVESYLFELPKEVAVTSTNAYTLNFSEDWKRIQSKLNIAEDARLTLFDLSFNAEGKIEMLTFDFIGMENEEAISYSIDYNPTTNQYRILRHKAMKDVPIYGQSVKVTRFFKVLNQVGVKNMIQNTKSNQYSMHTAGNIYKNRMTDQMVYLIEEGGKVNKVKYEELPPSDLSVFIIFAKIMEGNNNAGFSTPESYYYYSLW